MPGEGGNLRSGDKVKLGNFTAGTSIGFVLLQDAWKSSSKKVSSSSPMFFSNSNLNTGASENQG